MERRSRAPDDARHSVLSKARRPSQRPLDAFVGETASWIDRAHYGAAQTLEVEAKSALTPCRVPGEPWSLNPYVGCSHACLYCYVPTVAHVERERWGSYVVVKRNLPTVLAREVARKERREVFMSSATDPYQAAERDQRVTRRCLEVLARADWPLTVLTRSPLVVRDIDLLRSFSEVSVGLSVPTLDDGARRLLEPTAPPIAARLAALRRLADAGLETFANLAPTYPLSGGVRPGDVAAAFREAGVRYVMGGAWNYLASVFPALRGRVTGTALASFVRRVPDPRHWARLFGELRRAFRRAGVEFRVMSETPGRGSPYGRDPPPALSAGGQAGHGVPPVARPMAMSPSL